MEKSEVLRAIYNDDLVYIQKKVRVAFADKGGGPVAFLFNNRRYPIANVICHFKMTEQRPEYGLLVEDGNRNVFCLYSQLVDTDDVNSVKQGFWVLSFRIQNDDELMSWYREDRKMLANISLQQVVNFHGHICPELAIGGKFCEFVQNLFNTGAIPTSGFSVLAENNTSALDAIQVLLGATVGNQRLQVMDYGKHNYTLFSKIEKRGWKLKMKDFPFAEEEHYRELERKIVSHQAVFDDVVMFQQLLDAMIRRIMAFTPEELFEIEETGVGNIPVESTTVYLVCAVCGEKMLSSRGVVQGRMTVCMPCFQKMVVASGQYSIQ